MSCSGLSSPTKNQGKPTNTTPTENKSQRTLRMPTGRDSALCARQSFGRQRTKLRIHATRHPSSRECPSEVRDAPLQLEAAIVWHADKENDKAWLPHARNTTNTLMSSSHHTCWSTPLSPFSLSLLSLSRKVHTVYVLSCFLLWTRNDGSKKGHIGKKNTESGKKYEYHCNTI